MRRINAFLCALLIFSWGCTKGDKATSDPNTLVVAIASTPKTLDPRFATDAYGMRIAALLFNSLVRIGPDLKVTGDAAKSWSYKNKTYTFEIQPNLTFANGRRVTPEDIEFSFEQYRKDNNPFHSAFDVISDVTATESNGAITVKIALSNYSAKLLSSDLPVVKILPKKEFIQAGEDFNKLLIGSGSFKFGSQTANDITLLANEHAVVTPKVKKLVFKVIRDDFTRYQKTLKGSIDIAQAEIPPAKISDFEKRKDTFQIHKYPGLSMTYLLVNLKDPLLRQLPVRQALAYGLNREEIIKYKLEGLASPATSILTPKNPFFHGGLTTFEFSPEKAKSLLKAAKADEGKVLTLKTSNNQSAVENGRVIANQLLALGLSVKLQSYEWGTFYGDIRAGNFQLAAMRWVGAMDPDIYRIALHTDEKPPGRNRGNYSNKELDQLLEQGLSIDDESARIQHYKKVQEIVIRDLPIIPLWYDHQVAVVHNRVKGYAPPMNGDYSVFAKVEKKP